MKTIFFLIGPPKTGTTSLQHWLMDNAKNFFYYGGCRQPRDKYKHDDISVDIYKLSNSSNLNKEHVEGIREKISHIFNEYDEIILSEEMFLHTPGWRMKLNNLKFILEGFNLKFAICNRDATDVIPSYYAEVYGGLPLKLQNDYNAFVKSEWVSMFNLKEVEHNMEQTGFLPGSINYFSFKDLTKGSLTLNKIFNSVIESNLWNASIELENKNKKSNESVGNKDSKQYIVNINPLKKRHKIVKSFLKGFMRLSKNLFARDFPGLSNQVKSISIPRNSDVEELSLNNFEFISKWNNG